MCEQHRENGSGRPENKPFRNLNLGKIVALRQDSFPSRAESSLWVAKFLQDTDNSNFQCPIHEAI